MSFVSTLSKQRLYRSSASPINLVEAHSKHLLTLRKEKLQKKFAENRANKFTRVVNLSIQSLSHLVKEYTSQINEVNTLLPFLINWIPSHFSFTKEISIILDLVIELSLKDRKCIEYLVNSIHIINFIDIMIKQFKGVAVIEEKIIKLIGNIAVDKKKYRRKLIDINVIQFLLSIINEKNEMNVLWALSNVIKKIPFSSNSPIIKEVIQIAMNCIKNYDIEGYRHKDTLYHSITILYNLLSASVFVFIPIRDGNIFNHIFDLLTQMVSHYEAFEDKNIRHILKVLSDIFAKKFHLTISTYLVMNTHLIFSLSQCLTASSKIIQRGVYLIILNILAMHHLPFISVICSNETLINSMIHSEILDAFMCVTIILERGTHSMRMGLITKRIGEKIISIIAEAKSRQIKFEAYSALYIILDTIAYEDFDAVSAFKEDCEQKGIVDVIEKDMYDNNKEMAELAEKIIENFFICEISTEGTLQYE